MWRWLSAWPAFPGIQCPWELASGCEDGALLLTSSPMRATPCPEAGHSFPPTFP
jgi:hypothetical protein